MQQIRLQPVTPSIDEPDFTARRYQLNRGIRSMRDRQPFTDAVVKLDGSDRQWNVHRLVLASASSVFGYIFEDVEQTGGSHSVFIMWLLHQLLYQPHVASSSCISSMQRNTLTDHVTLPRVPFHVPLPANVFLKWLSFGQWPTSVQAHLLANQACSTITFLCKPFLPS